MSFFIKPLVIKGQNSVLLALSLTNSPVMNLLNTTHSLFNAW